MVVSRWLPDIEVAVVPSFEAPTGVGAPCVPVVAPAVANAMALLTGKRTFAASLSEVGLN